MKMLALVVLTVLGTVTSHIRLDVPGLRKLGPRPAAAATDPATACRKSKFVATAKKMKAKLNCYATAVGKGTAVTQSCLDKAETAFAKSFAAAQAKGEIGRASCRERV